MICVYIVHYLYVYINVINIFVNVVFRTPRLSSSNSSRYLFTCKHKDKCGLGDSLESL